MGILGDLIQKKILLISCAPRMVRLFVVRLVNNHVELDAYSTYAFSEDLFGDTLHFPGRVADIIQSYTAKYAVTDVYILLETQKALYGTYADDNIINTTELKTALHIVHDEPFYAWATSFQKRGKTYTSASTYPKHLLDELYSIAKRYVKGRVVFYPDHAVCAEHGDIVHEPQTKIIVENTTTHIITGLFGTVTESVTVPIGMQTVFDELQTLFARANPTEHDLQELLVAYGTSALTRGEAHKVHALIAKCLRPIILALQSQEKKTHALFGEHVVSTELLGMFEPYVGIVDDLSRALQREMRVVNPWQGIIDTEEYVPELPYAESLQYTQLILLCHVLLRGARLQPLQ